MDYTFEPLGHNEIEKPAPAPNFEQPPCFVTMSGLETTMPMIERHDRQGWKVTVSISLDTGHTDYNQGADATIIPEELA
ncbi:hypothetical protein NPIL_363351 [Nephila pilipes]|uniref:Uncharacterized protein n=1 Tax=Nephila pilipes TaxID=299642 RepID=A0A8X6IXW2_NEPPI|nr:hypothetical protein NPIL_363351 [Nephila pilipes]